MMSLTFIIVHLKSVMLVFINDYISLPQCQIRIYVWYSELSHPKESAR